MENTGLTAHISLVSVMKIDIQIKTVAWRLKLGFDFIILRYHMKKNDILGYYSEE